MNTQGETLVITREAATAHGLQPVSIRVDARAAGLIAREFPAEDVFLKLSGPPGGPLSVIIWDCPGTTGDLESVVREKMVPGWTETVEDVRHHRATLLGEQVDIVTFVTGAGISRTAWLACLVLRGGNRLLLAFGVGGRDGVHVPPDEVLANIAIKRVVESLAIEA